MSTRFTRHSAWWSALFLAIVSVLPLYVAYSHHTHLNDDTYITLTYAKNLAAGNGFVFNHPPATLGTTTPLLALMVASLNFILPWFTPAPLAVFLTALCWVGTAWTFFWFREQWQLAHWQAAVIGCVVIATGWISFLGMEVYLFSLLLVLTLSLFLKERYGTAGLLAGLLFLTRGEGALIILIMAATTFGRAWLPRMSFRLVPWANIFRMTTGFLAPVVLWAGYAQLTFGMILPNTLAAKQAQLQNGLGRRFTERLVTEWIPRWGNEFRIGEFPWLNVWWLIVFLGIAVAFTRKRNWLLLVAWMVIYTASYTVLNISAYWWYQLPIVFVLELLFGLGLVFGAEFLATRYQSVLGNLLAIGLVAFCLGISLQATVQVAREFQGDRRAASYLAISNWLHMNTQNSESVAAIEIGYLGYYTQNRIVDLAGLIQPEVVSHIGSGDFSWAFWQYQPDYYVYSPAFDWALHEINSDPRFEKCYEPVNSWPEESDYVIYHRLCE